MAVRALPIRSHGDSSRRGSLVTLSLVTLSLVTLGTLATMRIAVRHFAVDGADGMGHEGHVQRLTAERRHGDHRAQRRQNAGSRDGAPRPWRAPRTASFTMTSHLRLCCS